LNWVRPFDLERNLLGPGSIAEISAHSAAIRPRASRTGGIHGTNDVLIDHDELEISQCH